MTDKERIDCASIVQDLRDEADLCRSETADDIAGLLDDAASCIVAMKSQFNAVKSDLAARDAELERERIRLAACGVVAMSNTPESAAKMRQMKDEYRSASLSDVERAVDAEMALRADLAARDAELAAMKAENSKLRSALEIVHFKQEPWQ